MANFYRILFLGLFMSLAGRLQAQCPVVASANRTTIECGDTVLLSARPTVTTFTINVNFDSPAQRPQTGTGSSWSVVPNATYSNPCGPTRSGSGNYMWMGNQASVPRELATANLDLRAGGYIEFDMRFASINNTSPIGPIGSASPCEGPDMPDEGVYVEYKPQGSSTWVQIDYLSPEGGSVYRTNWNTYRYSIPAGAATAATQIRWIQKVSNGFITDPILGPRENDHWGLDDVKIASNNPTFVYDWLHDPATPGIFSTTPPVSPSHDTTYTVVLRNNAGISCTSSVNITVVRPTAAITASPNPVCVGSQVQLNAISSLIPTPPANCGVATNSCTGQTSIIGFGDNVAVVEDSYRPLGRVNPLPDLIQPDLTCVCVALDSGTCDNSARTQMIIRASEFPAYFNGGKLFSIAFNASGAEGNYQNFTVKIGCTSQNEFISNTDFQSNLTTVFSPRTVNFTDGWMTLPFDLPYSWTGSTNIVIQFSWSDPDYKTGNMYKVATPFFSTIHAYSCGRRGETEVGQSKRYAFRPAVRLGACYQAMPNLVYVWSPAAGLSNPGIANPVATVNATTTYSVSITEVGLARCRYNGTITVQAVAPQLSLPSSTIICYPSTSTQLNAVASPSAANSSIVSYSWSPQTGLSNPFIANPVASPPVSITYTLTVTDAMGCTTSRSIFVDVRNAPVPTPAFVGSNGPLCVGQDLQLSASLVTGVYSWVGPAGFASSQQNPLLSSINTANAGTYKVYIINNGCTSDAVSTNVVINSYQNSAFNYGASSFCTSAGTSSVPGTAAGVTGIFSAELGLVFVSNTSGQINLSASQAGTYTVTFTTDGPCPTSSSRTITIINNLPSTAQFSYAGPYCQNGTVNPLPEMTGISGVFSVSGSGLAINSSTGQLFLNSSQPGNYIVTNTLPASAGCTAASYSTQVSIVQQAAAPQAVNSGPVCAGVQVTFGASGGTGTYSWSGPGLPANTTGENPTIPAASASDAGTYSVFSLTGTCPSRVGTTQLVVNQSQNPTFTYSADNIFCTSGTNPVPQTATGSTGVFSSSTGLALNANNGQIQLAQSVPGTYQVTFTTNGACPSSHTETVVINRGYTTAQASFAYNGPYCQGAASALPQFASGASAGVFSTTIPDFVNSNSGELNFAVAPGTYSITNTLQGSQGCPNGVYTTQVTVNSRPLVPQASNSGPVCTGQQVSFQASNSTGTYSWTGPGFSSAGVAGANQLIQSATTATAGTYTVFNVIGSCSSAVATTTLVVNQPQSATFSYGSGNTYCSNGMNPVPNTANGVSGTFFSSTASVNTTTGELNLSGSPIGSHTITFTTNGPCPTSSSITVIINRGYSAGDGAFSYAGPYCQNGFTNPLPDVTGYSGTFSVTAGPAGGLALTASNGQIYLSQSQPGTYTVTNSLTGTGGCSSTSSTAEVVISPQANAPTITNSGSACVGGTITLQASAVSGGTYSWFGPGLPASGAAGATQTLSGVSASDAGTYSVYVTSGTCRSRQGTTQVVVNQPDNSTFNYGTTTMCVSAGQSPVPSTSNTGTFSSAPLGSALNTATGQINFAGLSGGSYPVTFTTQGSCPTSSTVSLTIVNNASSAAQFSYNGPYCNNSNQNPLPFVSGSYGVFSAGQGLTINGSTGQLTISASQPGTYQVSNTVSNTQGCPAAVYTAQVTVTPTDNSSFSYSSNAFCNSGPNQFPTTFATGIFTSTPNGLSIDPASGEVNLSTSALGDYTITFTTNGPCPTSSTFNLSISNNSSVIAAFSYNGPYCVNGFVNPSPTVTGTAGVFSVTAGPAGGMQLNPSTGEINLSLSQPGTYTVTNAVNNQNGCTFTYSTQVTITPQAGAPQATAGSTICEGQSAQLFASGGNGTYSWTGPGFGPAGTTGPNPVIPNATIAANGTYTVFSFVGNCPSVTDTVVLKIKATPVKPLANSNSPVCMGTNLQLSATGSSGVYSWSGPQGFVSNQQYPVLPQVTANVAGTYIVFTNLDGCNSVSDTVEVLVTPPTVVTTTPSATICNGSSYLLTASGATTYSWSNGATTPNITVQPSQAVTYTVYGLSNGCTGTATVTVTPAAILSATADSLIKVCGPGMVTLHASGGSIGNYYYWYLDTASVPVQTAIGQYTVYISDTTTVYVAVANGECVGPRAAIRVIVKPVPTNVFAGSDVTIRRGQRVTLQGTGGPSYSWSPPIGLSATDIANPIASPTTTTTYTLSVSNQHGCTTTDDVTVKVLQHLNIPNVFTPNGDGINDVWEITGVETIPNCNVEVFDRWGSLVYKSKGYTIPWNGRTFDNDVKQAVYYYVIYPNDGGDIIKGVVSILD